MFKFIKIENFRSCKLVVIDRMGPVMVLVGRNGVGKSNILAAIRWGASVAVSATPIDLSSIEGPSGVQFEIRSGGDTFRYSLKLESPTNEDELEDDLESNFNLLIFNDSRIVVKESIECKKGDRWEAIIRREHGRIELLGTKTILQVAPMTPCLAAMESLLPPADPQIVAIRPLVSFLRTVRYYHFDEPSIPIETSDFIAESSYKKWRENYRATGNPGNSVLMRLLYMKLEQAEVFDEFRSLAGSNGIKIVSDVNHVNYSIKSNEGSMSLSDDETRFHGIAFTTGKASGGQDHVFGLRSLSLGTRRVIRILASLLFDRSSVMLIEHPEDGIHPGLTKKIMGLLRSYADPLQLFITSHSLTVFNTLELEDIRFVTMVDGATKVRGLSKKEIKAARKYISEEGDMADVIQFIEE